MASCRSPPSEQHVLCSICLDVLTEPTSIPCGHNFCKVCISHYWDTTNLCQCPLCKETFSRRPKLSVNTTLRDLVGSVKQMKVQSVTRPREVSCGGRDEEKCPSRPGDVSYRGSDEEKCPSRPGDVSCDVCTGRKLKALKSCLVCLTSYCETHLEPHQRIAGLKKHKLIHPVENPEDRVCKKHDRLLEFFCRKDHACVCVVCMNTDHKAHNAVPLAEECGQRKGKLRKMMADIDQMMENRSKKVQQIKRTVETGKRDAERDISDSLEVFTALVSSIQRSQAELIRVIEEKQKAAEKQAEGFIKDLEQEITELKRRSSELEKLSHSEDHLHLLQTFPSLNTPPHTKDWSQISVHDGPCVGTVRIVSQLEDKLKTEMEKLPGVKLKRIQQYAVDVTLDWDTAHPDLILSEDGKRVRDGDKQKKKTPPEHPKRFVKCVSVLGKQSFSSRRFYYEVQVAGKTAWDLGVARESIDRKEKITLTPENGYWTIYLRNGDEYMALSNPRVLLQLREKPQKVGVFVDYEGGRVSFYNVEASSHIHSYTGCSFTGKLYPYFSPCFNRGGKNSAPLIITPVTHTAW